MARISFIKRRLARFRSDDRGAVTVDWVVLSAAVIGMALASVHVWRSSVRHNAEDVSNLMVSYQIKTTFE